MNKLAKLLQILLWLVLLLNLAAFFMLPSVLSAHYAQDSRELGLGLAIFYPCGLCTAVIILQGERVLSKIASRQPFHPQNAGSIRIAAFACFAISALAAIRLVVWLFWYPAGGWILRRYNTLFIAGFLLAGLLAMVLSELFRTAAELKADNDLVI